MQAGRGHQARDPLTSHVVPLRPQLRQHARRSVLGRKKDKPGKFTEHVLSDSAPALAIEQGPDLRHYGREVSLGRDSLVRD